MPLLTADSPELAGLDLGRLFSSELPDGGRQNLSFASLSRQEFAEAALRNFGQQAQLAAGRLGVAYGVPAFALPNLRTVVQDWPMVSVSAELLTAAVQGRIVGAIAEWGSALTGITSVPVLGWVVGLLKGAYDGVDGFIRLVSALGSKAPAAAYVYTKENDVLHARRIMALVGSRVWTKAFLPTVDADAFVSRQIAWGGDEPQGRRFQPHIDASNWDDPRGYGVVPGLPLIEDAYQYRYGRPPAELQGGAQLYPSAMQAGGLLWSMLQQPSAQMFSIHGTIIEAKWREWYDALGKASASPGEGVRMRTYAQRWWDADLEKPGGRRFAPYTPSYVGAPYNADRSIASLVAYIIGRWRARLKPTLETIICAYVPPEAPALSEPGVAEHYHAMRSLLLTHPARHEVEMDMVPDDEYRAALHTARLQGAHDMAAKGGAWSLEGAAGVAPSRPPLPPPPPLGGEAATAGGGMGAGLLVGGGALLGLGWLLARR